jgi:hypothetical protein
MLDDASLSALLLELAESIVFGPDAVYELHPRAGGLRRHPIGFGMGVTGIGYVLELALQSDTLLEGRARQTIEATSDKLSASLPIHMDTWFREVVGNVALTHFGHGFCSGISGALLFEKLRLRRTGQSGSLGTLSHRVLDSYSGVDLESVNPTFYGGTGGLLFFLLHVLALELDGALDARLRAFAKSVVDGFANLNVVDMVERLFRAMPRFAPPVGLAWGTSGVAYVLGLAHRFLGDHGYLRQAGRIVEFEDQYYDPSTLSWKRPELETVPLRPDPHWYARDSLCYGRAGLLLPRLLLKPTDCGLDAIRRDTLVAGPRTDTDDPARRLGYCCGVSSHADLAAAFQECDDGGTPHRWSWGTRLSGVELRSLRSGSFLDGVAGPLYAILEERTGHRNSVFKL